MANSSHATIKAFSAGVFAGSLDAYLLSSKKIPLNSVTLPRCLTFGAIVGGSFLVADMIAPIWVTVIIALSFLPKQLNIDSLNYRLVVVLL